MNMIARDYRTKGVRAVHYGHAEKNQTGMELSNNLSFGFLEFYIGLMT